MQTAAHRHRLTIGVCVCVCAISSSAQRPAFHPPFHLAVSGVLRLIQQCPASRVSSLLMTRECTFDGATCWYRAAKAGGSGCVKCSAQHGESH